MGVLPVYTTASPLCIPRFTAHHTLDDHGLHCDLAPLPAHHQIQRKKPRMVRVYVKGEAGWRKRGRGASTPCCLCLCRTTFREDAAQSLTLLTPLPACTGPPLPCISETGSCNHTLPLCPPAQDHLQGDLLPCRHSLHDAAGTG